MTLDETGIYIHVDSTGRLFYLYYNGVMERIGELTLSGFATTSPGTQPLPESKCTLHYITIMCIYLYRLNIKNDHYNYIAVV